jgi:hypothetical protein
MPLEYRVVYCDPDCRSQVEDDRRYFRSRRGAEEQASIHNDLIHFHGADCATVRKLASPKQSADTQRREVEA